MSNSSGLGVSATRRLAAEQVIRRSSTSTFKFEHTGQLRPPTEGIIGQPRAVEAMEFGLAMETPGYNLFLSGPVGTGKTT